MNNDLISREALNDIWELYKKFQPRLATNVYEFGEALRELIDNAPTECEKYRSFCMAKQRLQGEWLDVICENGGFYHGTCSICKTRNDIPPIAFAHFCPNCGADMRKGGAE